MGLVALHPRHKTHKIPGKFLADTHRDVANYSRDWLGLRWPAVGGGVSKTVALTFKENCPDLPTPGLPHNPQAIALCNA